MNKLLHNISPWYFIVRNVNKFVSTRDSSLLYNPNPNIENKLSIWDDFETFLDLHWNLLAAQCCGKSISIFLHCGTMFGQYTAIRRLMISSGTHWNELSIPSTSGCFVLKKQKERLINESFVFNQFKICYTYHIVTVSIFCELNIQLNIYPSFTSKYRIIRIVYDTRWPLSHKLVVRTNLDIYTLLTQ